MQITVEISLSGKRVIVQGNPAEVEKLLPNTWQQIKDTDNSGTSVQSKKVADNGAGC
jgi:hypothetical protein